MDTAIRKKRRLTGMENADPDFVGLGREDLDLLDLERLAGAPADSGLAGDDLSSGVGHDGCCR